MLFSDAYFLLEEMIKKSYILTLTILMNGVTLVDFCRNCFPVNIRYTFSEEIKKSIEIVRFLAINCVFEKLPKSVLKKQDKKLQKFTKAILVLLDCLLIFCKVWPKKSYQIPFWPKFFLRKNAKIFINKK